MGGVTRENLHLGFNCDLWQKCAIPSRISAILCVSLQHVIVFLTQIFFELSLRF
jgi:hypothetical protein